MTNKSIKLIFNCKAYDSFNGTNDQRNIELTLTKDCQNALGIHNYAINAGFSQNIRDEPMLAILAKQAFQDFKGKGFSCDPTVTFHHSDNRQIDIQVSQP